MTAYLIRRLLLMIPTVLGIMLVSFVVVQFAPGGPIESIIAKLSGADIGAGSRTGWCSGPAASMCRARPSASISRDRGERWARIRPRKDKPPLRHPGEASIHRSAGSQSRLRQWRVVGHMGAGDGPGEAASTARERRPQPRRQP